MRASTALTDPAGEQATDGGHSPAARGLVLAALGVVFGDIGTSPLYALQTVFSIDNGAVRPTPGDVYGVISLMFWSITLIVSVKYVSVIMRADNDGEGGVMALAALAQRLYAGRSIRTGLLLVIGIIGVSLFYGDSVITPAISVLSAVEGLQVAAPSLEHVVVPVAAVILTCLFAVQRFGTGRVGRFFGPVMVVWFGVLALAGLHGMLQHPGVLRALSPSYAVLFGADHPFISFVAMGAVVLVITGAEALYADMGHFGPAPIRRAWFFLVFPALTLNYLGQARADPALTERGRQPVLPAAAELEPAADGGAGHRGHRDRQPGGHLRSVLAVPAGDAAGAAAAADGPADLRAARAARSTCPR